MKTGDARCLAALLCFAAAFALTPALLGRTFFWGDLTYLHHPWHVLPAQILQGGRLPLWNPYAYLGMPLAGHMQCAAWYPGTLPFHLFRFENALALYHAAHYALAGLFSFLWLKRLGFSRGACLGGALAYMLGGGLASRVSFLNHVSVLAHFPALLLFSERPLWLGLALSSAFFSGYPPMLGGAACAAFVLSLGLAASGAPSGLKAAAAWSVARAWLLGGLLAAGLSACLLAPAAELAALSRRGGGIELEEVLRWGFEPSDLRQFLPPPLIPREDFSPPVLWWKTAYQGFLVWIFALAGLRRLAASARRTALAYAAGATLLILGASNPLSLWLWTHLAPLRYIRYPGNTAYLLLPLFAFLCAVGLDRRRFGALAALALGLELLAYGLASHPTVPRGYFESKGPLVERLQASLAGRRYLLSPLALQWHRGRGARPEEAYGELKQRLYGVTGMPYRLRAVANFGEPLVPRSSYDLMDFLYRLPNLKALAPWMGWLDAGILLTRERLPAPGFDPAGSVLWEAYKPAGPVARAWWLESSDGEALPAAVPDAAPEARRAVPAVVVSEREDRFTVSGVSPRPGWVFISEPLYPGWRARGGEGPVLPALGAFQKTRVPAGAWRLDFRYEPLSWRLGLACTCAFLLALGAYWYNRLRRFTAPS